MMIRRIIIGGLVAVWLLLVIMAPLLGITAMIYIYIYRSSIIKSYCLFYLILKFRIRENLNFYIC
jgi:hypothetical protein